MENAFGMGVRNIEDQRSIGASADQFSAGLTNPHLAESSLSISTAVGVTVGTLK